MKKRKGRIDRSESFDEFLAKDGLFAETENAALKEIIAAGSTTYSTRAINRPRSRHSAVPQRRGDGR